MNIAHVCTRGIVMAQRQTSLKEAATLMREQHVGTLLVVESVEGGDQAVGIVTDRDLVIDAMARGLDAAQTPLERLTQRNLAIVPASATLDQAIAAMKERGVRRVLVTNEDGALAGIASLDDLLDGLAQQMSELAHALRGGIEREAAERPPLAAQPPSVVHVPVSSYT